jgi:hypothetical protein
MAPQWTARVSMDGGAVGVANGRSEEKGRKEKRDHDT